MKSKVSPIVIVVAAVVLVAVIGGTYYALMTRESAVPEGPEFINDPYASQYNAPPATPPEDGVPPAPGRR